MREWQRGKGEGEEELQLALLNCCMYLRVSELIYQLLHKLNARNWKRFRPVIKILKLNASSFPFLTTKRNRSGSRDLGISRKMPHCGTAPHLGPVDQLGKSRKKIRGEWMGWAREPFSCVSFSCHALVCLSFCAIKCVIYLIVPRTHLFRKPQATRLLFIYLINLIFIYLMLTAQV